MRKYTIGLDFGTLSCRAVIVDVSNGSVVSTGEAQYAHGVMTQCLPDGSKLPEGWALQHPQDYLDAMIISLHTAINSCYSNIEDIIGIGVDFTASTTIPVLADGTPLCFLPEFEHEKHAYAKLWKHHGSQKQTEYINKIAKEYNFDRIMDYGGSFNNESSLPRVLALLEEAPDVYNRMDEWIEAGDWIVWTLTGILSRGESGAGIKSLYDCHTKSYPDKDFLRHINPRLEKFYTEKQKTTPLPLGTRVGHLTNEMAVRLGLKKETFVAVANMDGHVSGPIIGMESSEQVMAVIGTSCGWFALSTENNKKDIPGICCRVSGSMWPDLVCYESGQSCVGDMYQWFIDNSVPIQYHQEAKKLSISIHALLTQKAKDLKPGESGLLALDWFNGNRAPLADSELTSMIVGMTLQTKPEEIYRALLESSAFGGRVIVENFKKNGLPINSMIAVGGISRKNQLAMQIYADVLGMPVYIAGSDNGPAHGSALFGAVAAGTEVGGYDTVIEASKMMRQPFAKVYQPIEDNVIVYNKLFTEYKTFFEYFGNREKSSPMKRLLEIKRNISEPDNRVK